MHFALGKSILTWRKNCPQYLDFFINFLLFTYFCFWSHTLLCLGLTPGCLLMFRESELFKEEVEISFKTVFDFKATPTAVYRIFYVYCSGLSLALLETLNWGLPCALSIELSCFQNFISKYLWTFFIP